MSDPAFARVSLLEVRAPRSLFSPLRPRAADATIAPPEPDRFTMGFAEGGRAATEAFALERAALLGLVAAAEALQPEPSEELAVMIAATVERLVTAIVGTMPIDAAWLGARIDRALLCIDAADAARTLWLHPDDVALVAETGLTLDLRADDSLERGALRIEGSAGWIEDGRAHQLAALRTSLGIVAES